MANSKKPSQANTTKNFHNSSYYKSLQNGAKTIPKCRKFVADVSVLYHLFKDFWGKNEQFLVYFSLKRGIKQRDCNKQDKIREKSMEKSLTHS